MATRSKKTNDISPSMMYKALNVQRKSIHYILLNDKKNPMPHSDLVDKIYEFVQFEGNLDGEFCFLSIEDGGGFQHAEGDFSDHIRELKAYINYPIGKTRASGIVPKDVILKRSGTQSANEQLVGIPGEKIAKIMFNLTGKSENSTDYMRNQLYRVREFNLKYYPLARKKKANWYKHWKSIGLYQEDYTNFCKDNRCKTILNLHRNDILKSKIIIICGAKNEWVSCLRKIIDIDESKTQSFHSQNSHIEYFYLQNNNLAFSYIDVFKRGLSDEAIFSFCQGLINRSNYIKNNYINIGFAYGNDKSYLSFPSYSVLRSYIQRKPYLNLQLSSTPFHLNYTDEQIAKTITKESFCQEDFDWLIEKNGYESRFIRPC